MARAPKPKIMKTTGKPRRSSTGGPGERQVEMAEWRRKLRVSRLKFDDRLKREFLDEFVKHGRFQTSCLSVDTTPATVRSHIENDPEFAEAFEAAKQTYRDKVHSVITLLAIDGLEEPIIGGEFRDQVVAHKRIFATNLVMAEARRVDPGYKDQTTVDLTIKSGVLLAPPTTSPAEWAAQFAKPRPDDAKGE